MNVAEVSVLLWRLLKRCDKHLVRHIVRVYWLPAETRLAIKLRRQARYEFFCSELENDIISQHWWYVLNELCISRGKGMLGFQWTALPIGSGWRAYYSVRQWRHAAFFDAQLLRVRHNYRMMLCFKK
jgi:hypothetical protein